MTVRNVLQFIRMNLGTVLKFALIVLEFILFFTLMIIAMIGGATEKLWLVLAVIPCFAMWVLYLIFKRESMRSVIASTNTALTQTREELENYKRLRVRRADLLSRHVD